MNDIECKAYAKVNLGLDVIKRRTDGYHEVRMIMQTISLHDTIIIEKKEEQTLTISTDSKILSNGPDNLVYKAANLLLQEFKPDNGVNIRLKKQIPIAAGMAGGSTDAAAVLRGINELFDLKLSKEELMQRAITLGADVPYCVVGGTMLAEGIGEKLTELPDTPACHILIAKPTIAVSTKWVYENLHANELTYHPNIDKQLDGLNNQNLKMITEHMGNVLETVTVERYPVIREIKNIMLEECALNAMMSGSGPTVFGIFDDEKQMQKAYQRLSNRKDIEALYQTEMTYAYE